MFVFAGLRRGLPSAWALTIFVSACADDAPLGAAIDRTGRVEDAGSAPAEPAIHFVGRTDLRAHDGVRFAWSGSGLTFRFLGSEAAVRLDDRAGFFTVVLDGVEQAELATTPGERTYTLASGLPAGTHDIALYRQTEPLVGPTLFLGLELGAGRLLAPRMPAHRIELIGDSLSAGYGNEGIVPTCPFGADTEKHWLSYGAIVARTFDAELATIAWSGKGAIFNYGDDTFEPLPALYARAVPSDSASTWDFTRWQPELVVVNLGTNDFSTDNDPSAQPFCDAYAGLLAEVRAHYPDAFILCLVPSGLDGTNRSTAEQYIGDVVRARAAAGDDKLVLRALDFASIGAGCDYHPSRATHDAMAASLTELVVELMGW